MSAAESAFSLLANRDFWNRCIGSSLSFAPSCLLPAAVLAVANSVMLTGLNIGCESLIGLQEQINFEELARVTVQLIVASLVGLVLSLWAIWLWLLRLAAFARAFFTYKGDGQIKDFAPVISHINGRAGYLREVWLIGSTYLIVPLIPFMILSVIKTITSPLYASNLKLPVWAASAASGGIAILGAIITAVALVVLIVSATSKRKPADAARFSISLSIQNGKDLILATILITAICLVVSGPYFILFSMAGENGRLPLTIDLAFQLWLALSSTVIFPVCVGVFCKILESPVRHDGIENG